MEKTTIYLPIDLRMALKETARRTGRPQAELVRDAISVYVAHHKRPRLRSIGIVASGEISATDVEDWLEENWKPDW